MIRSHASADVCKAVAREVQRALKAGILVKPSDCSWCGDDVPLQAHHPDYDRPLMVVWICGPCHSAHHARYYADRVLMLGEVKR